MARDGIFSDDVTLHLATVEGIVQDDYADHRNRSIATLHSPLGAGPRNTWASSLATSQRLLHEQCASTTFLAGTQRHALHSAIVPSRRNTLHETRAVE